LFVIEEDAFDRLQQYLQRLEASLQGETGIAEIIEDIEMRFAELLMTYLGETRKVSTIDDVQKGIASLGEPEEISEESAQEQPRPKAAREWNGSQRKLFRDPENGVLAGVCSGFAAYINIDVVIVRILFIVLSFIGLAIPLYIILWVIVPNASTPSERLQMHGRPVTVDSLKEEFVKATDRIKDDTIRAKNRFQSDNEHIIKRAGSLMRIIGKIIGIGMIGGAAIWLILFTLTVSGIIDFIPTTGDSDYTSVHDFLQLVAPVNSTFNLMWAAILIVGFAGPLLAILLGARLIMERSTRFFKVSLIILPVILAVGIVCGIVSGLKTGRDFAVFEGITRQHWTTNTNQLIIEEMPHYVNNQRIVSTGGFDFIYIHHGKIQEQGVLITYRASKDSLFHVDQIVRARGIDHSTAIRRSGHVVHAMQLLGQKLVIDPNFAFPATDGFREQEIEVVIEVPANKKLIIKGLTIENPAIEYHGKLYANEPFETWE
jgi:phage shock protein PspC (stress-responsive transcriptional regulator)